MSKHSEPRDNPFNIDLKVDSDAEEGPVLNFVIDFVNQTPIATVQTYLHSIIRQITSNIKMEIDRGGTFTEIGESIKKNPGTILSGFKQRFLGNMLSLGPSSAVNGVLDKNDAGVLARTMTSAVIDTVVGSAVEVKAMAPKIKEIYNTDVSSFKNLAARKVYMSISLPSLVRNFMEWGASSMDIEKLFGYEKDKELSLPQKMALRTGIGAGLGVLIAFPDVAVNRSIEHMLTNPKQSPWRAVMSGVKELFKKELVINTLKRGIYPRIASGISGTLMFSSEAAQFISNLSGGIADSVKAGFESTPTKPTTLMPILPLKPLATPIRNPLVPIKPEVKEFKPMPSASPKPSNLVDQFDPAQGVGL